MLTSSKRLRSFSTTSGFALVRKRGLSSLFLTACCSFAVFLLVYSSVLFQLQSIIPLSGRKISRLRTTAAMEALGLDICLPSSIFSTFANLLK